MTSSVAPVATGAPAFGSGLARGAASSAGGFIVTSLAQDNFRNALDDLIRREIVGGEQYCIARGTQRRDLAGAVTRVACADVVLRRGKIGRIAFFLPLSQSPRGARSGISR